MRWRCEILNRIDKLRARTRAGGWPDERQGGFTDAAVRDEHRPDGRDPAGRRGPDPAGLARPDKYDGAVKARTFAEMPVEAIVCGPQPRIEFDAGDLQRLAESIKRFGQLAPIRVRHDPAQGAWVVLVGERGSAPASWRAWSGSGSSSSNAT